MSNATPCQLAVERGARSCVRAPGRSAAAFLVWGLLSVCNGAAAQAQAPYVYPGMASPEEYLAQARARAAQSQPHAPVPPSEMATEADPLPAGVTVPALPDRERLMQETEAQLRGAPLATGAPKMPPMRFPGVPVPTPSAPAP